MPRPALRAGWSARPPAAAGARIDRICAASWPAVASRVIEVDQVLAETAGALGAAKARLAAEVAPAAARPACCVDRDGAVRAAPGADPPTRPARRRDGGGRSGRARPGRRRRPGGRRPAGGADGGARRTGWVGTAAAVPAGPRRVAAAGPRSGGRALRRPSGAGWSTHEPELVGGLDGVPAAARDQANRLLLDGTGGELLAERRRLTRRPRWTRWSSAALLRCRRPHAAAWTRSPSGSATTRAPRAYLLGLEPRRGRPGGGGARRPGPGATGC